MGQRGVLLVNLGSPDSTKVADVRRYLAEFLSDPKVLDTPWIIRMLLLYLVILPSRPKDAAHAYEQIWTEEGSPLVVSTRKVGEMLAKKVEDRVEIAMRYGSPSIMSGLKSLKDAGCTEIFVVPLYPHYAMSSFETVITKVHEDAQLLGGLSIRFQPPFYEEHDYIEAMYSVAKPYLEQGYDHLLFSYHGIPERHLRLMDPSRSLCMESTDCCDRKNPIEGLCYRRQCFQTTRAFVARAKLAPGTFSNAFQSRLGKDPWLQPYTDHVLEALPKQGVKRLLVICPSFVSDCLETLEEIQMRGKESFLGAGGESLEQIPCLNESTQWVDVLKRFVTDDANA